LAIVCSFFGHRDAGDHIHTALAAEIERHITEYHADTFYVGGYGQFDGMADRILYDMKDRWPHISVYRILAYLPTGVDKNSAEKQHPTIYPEGLETVPRQFAITRRNRWIVEQSEYIIGYVCTSWGGAHEALEYAKRKGKSVINLAERG